VDTIYKQRKSNSALS